MVTVVESTTEECNNDNIYHGKIPTTFVVFSIIPRVHSVYYELLATQLMKFLSIFFSLHFTATHAIASTNTYFKQSANKVSITLVCQDSLTTICTL